MRLGVGGSLQKPGSWALFSASRSEIVEIQLLTQYFHRVFLHLLPA